MSVRVLQAFLVGSLLIGSAVYAKPGGVRVLVETGDQVVFDLGDQVPLESARLLQQALEIQRVHPGRWVSFSNDGEAYTLIDPASIPSESLPGDSLRTVCRSGGLPATPADGECVRQTHVSNCYAHTYTFRWNAQLRRWVLEGASMILVPNCNIP